MAADIVPVIVAFGSQRDSRRVHLDVEIDAIEQWARESAQVAPHLIVGAHEESQR